MSERVKVTSKTPESKRDNSVSQTRKPDFSQSINSPIDQILFLQRTIGNQVVQRLFKSGVIQAKLKIGQANDIYEQEAERVAEQVMRMPEPRLQRQAEEEEEEEELIQTKPLAEQITPLVRRQVEEEEEEELIQAKLVEGARLQRQEEPEEGKEEEKEEESEKPCIDKLGSCDFYKCLSDLTPGDIEKGYYWNYGYKYCEMFRKSSLTKDPKAARWIDCVKLYLQKEILKQCIRYGNDLNKVKECAYATHAKVYTDCGICELDRIFIKQFRVALVPDLSDIWGKEGLKQIGETLTRCFFRPFIFQTIIDSFTTWYGDLHEDKLGKCLATLAKADPESNYKIILGVIELLSWTFDDDDVALEFMKSLTKDEINALSETPDGRRILFLMKSSLESGVTFPEEKTQIERVSEKSSRFVIQRLPMITPTESSNLIQAKFTVEQSNDKFKQKADRIAEQVMRMPEPQVRRQAEEEEEEQNQTKPLAEQITPLIQRQVEEEGEEKKGEEETLQTKEVFSQTPEVTPNLEARINAMRDRGQPLPESVRNFFEPRFGYEFSQVKLHTDAQAAEAARAVNAQAFTVGRNIVFGNGQYPLETTKGKRLLAHELTHTLQQRSGSSMGPIFAHVLWPAGRLRHSPLPVYEDSRPVLARSTPPQEASPPSSLATDIMQGKLPFKLVFYREDVLTMYPDVEGHAERLAAAINAPRIPQEWSTEGACPSDLSELSLAIGATKIRGDILPWVKGAFSCLKDTKIKELHILGDVDEGLKLQNEPGPELKLYVAPDVRLFFHGCLMVRFGTKGFNSLKGALGDRAKIFAHWDQGEPGRPIDFFEVGLPSEKGFFEKKFVDNYVKKKILPEPYIRDWATSESGTEEGRRDLRNFLLETEEFKRPTEDVRKIIIEILAKRLPSKEWIRALLIKMDLLRREKLTSVLKNPFYEVIWLSEQQRYFKRFLGIYETIFKLFEIDYPEVARTIVEVLNTISLKRIPNVLEALSKGNHKEIIKSYRMLCLEADRGFSVLYLYLRKRWP